jgi:hypothetical protein
MKSMNIEKRIEKSLAFLKNKNPGSFIFARSGFGVPGFESWWVSRLTENPVEYYLDTKRISIINNDYLKEFRGNSNRLEDLDDDTVPNIEVYFSIGSIVSMMCGSEVTFQSGTGWSHPNLKPEEIDLTFNPDNPWVQFHLMVSQDLINKWEGDFTLIPNFFRSPLDAANGLLGDKIFLMMYDDPETVLTIAMGCADWSVKLNEYLVSNLKWPKGLYRGAWGLALPDNAVFVNGDPVDLISEELQQKFDRLSSEKLFTNTGGGFFHHHALGIRQAVGLSRTKGMLVQNIYTDPNVEIPIYAMIKDEKTREDVIEASLRTPIHVNADFLPIVDELIPIVKRGCFILRQDKTENAALVLARLRKAVY